LKTSALELFANVTRPVLVEVVESRAGWWPSQLKASARAGDVMRRWSRAAGGSQFERD
jgi:hypothetical protein